MKLIKLFLLTAVLLAVVVTPTFAQEGTIADAAVASPDFETLVAAAQAAGLVDTLASPGPFTVFAPTDGAFGTLLSDLGVSAEQLLADTDLLRTVLLYHVVPGEFTASDILGAELPLTVTSAGGANIIIDLDPESGRVRLNGGQATVSQPDLFASNGVIHVLDNVILPPSIEPQQNIVQIAVGNPDFETLVAAVQAAGLVDTLAEGGPFTVFAPTDAAFAALLSDLGVTAEELLADTDLLTDVLLYHVVPGKVMASDIVGADSLPLSATTVGGGALSIDVVGGGVVINGSTNVVSADIEATNGVIHVIDSVLLP